MAFVEADLKCVSGAGKVREYNYITDDTIAATIADDYFNNATSYLRKGDIIKASCDQDGTEGMTIVTVGSETAAASVTTVKTA